MSIKNNIRIINRVEQLVTELQKKYPQKTDATDELTKLKGTLNKLTDYLNHLDQLQPDYNTDEINQYMENINLHLAILKGELEANEYSKLSKGTKAIRTVLRFHSTKYSFFTFIIAWIVEFIYFI